MSNYTVQLAPPEHLSWLRERLRRPLTPQLRAVEVVDSIIGDCPRCGGRHGRIMAMLGFEFWTSTSAGVHCAGDSPVAWRRAREALRFAMDAFGLQVLWAMVSESEESLRPAAWAGFREAGRVPGGFAPGVDIILLVMERRDVQQP